MPIVMSKEEWARINHWTNKDKEDPEVARRREYVQYLDAASQKMTKHWPNSLENVNKRNEELRRARIEAAEQTNSNFYKRYVKRARQEQQRLMHSARDTIFKNKDAPKLLLSAVIETAIQKERQEQLKFLAERRKEEAEQKKRDDEDIIRKAKEWHELMALRNKRRVDANKQYQKEILDQAHEVAERNRLDYETELNLQKLDNIKANKEINAIKDFEQNFNAAEKARIMADMQMSRKEAETRAREAQARDQLDDQLLAVLGRSRARVDTKRTQTERQTREEKLRVLEKISQKLESGDAAREAMEQAILDKAVDEKQAVEAARHQALLEKQARFKQERIDSRHQFLLDEAQRIHEFNTTRQWEIMNRFKNAELYEDFKEKAREEKVQKIKAYREDILKLWKEREDREAQQLADTRHFYGELALAKMRDADNKLLSHADHLVEEAGRLGRPARPLLRAIDRYCKLHRLYPMPGLPKSMQEHFSQYAPVDGSRPDPWYQSPAPPPQNSTEHKEQRDKEAKLEPTHEKAPKRDGLQIEKMVDMGKGDNNSRGSSYGGCMHLLFQMPGPSKDQIAIPDDEFKRHGRANGLQRRDAQEDVHLPPIKAVPCQSETSDLKK